MTLKLQLKPMGKTQRKAITVLVVSMLFFSSKSRSVYAFNLIDPPASEPNRLTFSNFQIPGSERTISGYTETKSIVKLAPPQDPKTNPQSIITQLEDPANSWSGSMVFKSASQPLSSLAQFIISDYHPCIPTDPCNISSVGNTGLPSVTGAIGTALTINYVPSTLKGDPTPLEFGSSIGWIQRFTSNDNKSSKYGTSVLDIAGSNFPPFYTSNGSLLDPEDPWEYIFQDRPRRRINQDFLSVFTNTQTFNWTAELYLATSRLNQTTGKYEVTLYDGIQWGWKTTLLDPKKPTPPPGAPSNAPAPPQAESVCNYVVHAIYSGVVYDGCDLVASNALEANPDMAGDAATNLHFTGDTQPSPQNAAGVPEPSPIAGAILAVGLWGGVTWQKKRRNKPIKP